MSDPAREPVTGTWRKPTITGERVLLRPITAEDAEAMWEAVQDPEGRDLTATTATFTREQVAAWAASRADQAAVGLTATPLPSPIAMCEMSTVNWLAMA